MGDGICEKDVMALRGKTAKKLFATANPGDPNKGVALERMLEVIAYDQPDEYMNIVDELSTVYIAELSALETGQAKSRKGEVLSLKKSCDVLTRNKVVPEDFLLKAALVKTIRMHGLDKKK